MNASFEFPLSWPPGRPRTAGTLPAKFGRSRRTENGWRVRDSLTLHQAADRVLAELERLGGREIVVTANVPLRRDGNPRSDTREPDDHGVAVYFELDGQFHCLAADKWDRVADNLAAVAAHVEAVRGQLRWGVGDAGRALAGFKALPPLAPWWKVLGFEAPAASVEEIKARQRKLALEHHPDRGGSPARMAEITEAAQAGITALGAA